jgi:hypothetical protein
MSKEKKEDITIVFVEVPLTEWWRFLCCCVSCFWPPKYIRVKNHMAKSGWTYERTDQGYLDGHVQLKFWKKTSV